MPPPGAGSTRARRGRAVPRTARRRPPWPPATTARTGRRAPVPGPARTERERGHHAEVPAAAPLAGPEQVSVMVRVGGGGEHRAVRRDDLQRLEVVAGQAVGPGGYPDAAAERQAGDADRRAGAGHRTALGREAVVEVDQPGARADGGARAGHGDRLQVTDVDDQPARARPAGVAVPAGARGERHAELADERQARRHVVRVPHVGDARRALAVEPRVEEQARGPVAGVTRTDQRACQVPAEGGPVGRDLAGRAGEDAGRGKVPAGRGAGHSGCGDHGGPAGGDAEERAALQRTLCWVAHVPKDAAASRVVAYVVIT